MGTTILTHCPLGPPSPLHPLEFLSPLSLLIELPFKIALCKALQILYGKNSTIGMGIMAEKKDGKPSDQKPQDKNEKKDPDGKLLLYIIFALAIIYIYLMLFGIFSHRHTVFIYPD